MKGIARSIKRKLFHLHIDLKEYGKKKGIVTGTTVSILLVAEQKYLICHLGDSAIFRIKRKNSGLRWIAKFGGGSLGRTIRRMTKIHGDAVSGLERCIGSGRYYPPDVMCGRLRKHMAFLVSSDGFWHHLKEDEIGNTFQGESARCSGWAEKRLRALAAKALRRGETDNISAIYLSQ